MVLDADDDSELGGMVRAGTNIGRDPFLYLIALGAFRDCFPGLRSHLGVGKHAYDGSTELGGYFGPVLDALHVNRSRRLIRHGEIISDSRAADAEAKIECAAFQVEDVFILWHAGSILFVAGKIITGGV